MKKQTKTPTKASVTVNATLLFGLGFVLLAVGFICQQMQIAHMRKNHDNAVQRLYNDVDGDMSSPVVVSPQDNRVYVPELRISLPYNNITKTLRYTYTDQDGARFYSALVTDHAEHRISCYDMVRVKHEAKPNAYSPGQPHVATVDAGTPPLQLYAEKNDECAAQAWLSITPLQIADELKHAQTY